jgi:hypothetical protein
MRGVAEDPRGPGLPFQEACLALVRYEVDCIDVRKNIVLKANERYANRFAMRLHSLSLRQWVSCPVPSLCRNALSSDGHGIVREKNLASLSRASSQVIPDLI